MTKTPRSTTVHPYAMPSGTTWPHEPLEINRPLDTLARAFGEQWIGDVAIRPYLCHVLEEHGGTNTPWHFHPVAEITFIDAGKMRYDTEESELIVGAGEMIVLPPNLVHRRMTASQRVRHFSVVASLLPCPGHRQSLSMHLGIAAKQLGYRFDPGGFVSDLVRQLMNSHRMAGPYADIDQAALLTLLLTRVLDQLRRSASVQGSDTKSEDASKTGTLLQLAEQYIDTNLAFQVTPTSVATHFQISNRHLNRLFYAGHGMSVQAFIDNRRLETAKRLLGNPRLLVKQVALMSGFRDASYFSRWFQRHTGCSPSELASRIRSGEPGATLNLPGDFVDR